MYLQDLRSKLEKAESVLKLAEMCRKLETEQEKVVPFWSITGVTATAPGQQPGSSTLDEQQMHILRSLQQQQNANSQGKQAAGSDCPHQEQPGLPGGAGQQPGEATTAAAPAAGVASSSVPGFSAVGLDDAGKAVEEWDYLNK